VIEHAEFPIELVFELQRVARRAVVLATDEFRADRTVIEQQLFRRCGLPHAERSVYHPDDMKALFGDEVDLRSQFVEEGIPTDPTSAEACRDWLTTSATADSLVPGGRGALALHPLDRAARGPRRTADDELLDGLLAGPCVAATPLEPLQPPLRHFDPSPDPTADELRAVLEQSWPHQRQRIAHVLHLRESFLIPHQLDRVGWDFGSRPDRRGWLPAPSLVPRSDADGFRFLATDGDPWLISPSLGIPATRLRGINLRMRIHNPEHPRIAGSGQIFWLGEADDTLHESRSATFGLINDGEPHDYRIDLRTRRGWPASGRIVALRIDPADGPCEIDVVSLALDLDDRGSTHRSETCSEPFES
jgi:hypothetical protein